MGKSSLVNSLLKEERVVVDDLAGTTRDSILNSWVYKGRKIHLVDTAGIEKALHYKEAVDKKIRRETLNAIRFSQVVILMIDGYSSFRMQDFSIANYIIEQGRGISYKYI